MSGQVPNPSGVQLPSLPQQASNSLTSSTQNFVGQSQSRVADLAQFRANVREYSLKYLQKKCIHAYELQQKLPEVAKRFEERIFRDAASKEDYMNLGAAAIEQRLHPLSVALTNGSRYTSAAASTMIPTPGMAQNGITSSLISGPADTSMISANGPGFVARTSVNSGNLLSTANGLGGVENSSLNMLDGQVPNSYGNVTANVSPASGGNNNTSSIPVPHPSSQMIPTPGLNNFQPSSSATGFSNGAGLMIDDTALPMQQPRSFSVSQTGRIMHAIGAQLGGRMRPVLQSKSSYYGLPNGVINGGLGLTANNLQLLSGHTASEGYLGAASYGNSLKPLQEHFDQQNQQTFLPTSMPQPVMPMTGDGCMLNPVDLTASSNLYSSVPSAAAEIHIPNMNPISLHSKSKMSAMIDGSSLSTQFIRQNVQLNPQIIDQPQNLIVQSSHSTREHVSQLQHQLPNFQQQHFVQQPNQSPAHIVKQQHQQVPQQGLQHQQILQRTDFSRQNAFISNIATQQTAQHVSDPNTLLFNQPVEQFNVSVMQDQFQYSGDAQLLSHFSVPDEFQHSISQDLQQSLPLQQNIAESHGEFSCLSSMPRSETALQGHWRPQPRQRMHVAENLSLEQQICKDFNQRITGQEEAQQPQSTTGKNVSDGLAQGFVDKREQDYLKQRRWILLLLHARGCPAPEGSCKEVNCITVQALWVHMGNCTSDQCEFARCCGSRKLFNHYLDCRTNACPVCVPVRNFIAAAERKASTRHNSGNAIMEQVNGSWRAANATDASDEMLLDSDVPITEPCADEQSLSKRLKTQHASHSLVLKDETSPVFIQFGNQLVSQETQVHGCQDEVGMPILTKSEIVEVKNEMIIESGQVNKSVIIETIDDDMENARAARSDCELLGPSELNNLVKQEKLQDDNQNAQVKAEVKHETSVPANDSVMSSKSGKSKIKGVSLTELFTPEQVRAHIMGLRQWVGQSKAKAEKNQAMEHSMSENSCQLCAVEKLSFEPPPIYCSPCGARIKRNAMYYTIGAGDTRHYFCIPCYNEARGDCIEVEGSMFTKSKLEKRRNDEETEEWWVQCDKCEAWQHQICALFNGRRNDGGQAEYTCPNCYIEEVERGERMPLPQSAVLGAKDLPRTLLSDHMEQRLFRRLKEERQARAKQLGKSYDEVPGAEALVVRVVSSVDKKLDVKPRFLEIFQEDNYPTEFAYKSKVVLLFQKIEGVEVCLFGMYVQEFGSDCQFPNQRRVYLSYLDSVKYFRPEIKTVTGEALRTFVYHEILIGYLEYCKKRGFTSCYIWACPPLKGEDYILYCHPEIQKTPKSDKLREWYLAMLRKAAKESIVADLTNLYDHFFITTGECKAKVTAARLPYFDGDYWPGAAEDMINQLRQEEDGMNQHKKGKTKKTMTKRALKAAGQADLTGNASKDALLMQKLGETIFPMKEDFIMVHLQHACTHCCILMVSGMRWVCSQCKNFQLCDKCHDVEQRLEDREKHPINSREKHALCPIEINDVCQDTKDKDEILESEFFDTRQAFLSLCQGNHYQYDTLRRAKHSSIMVLYHLHNPTAPAFVTTCNVCHHDIEAGQGWRCEVCPDFDVCIACYQRDGGVDHPHRLTNHPSTAERDAQNKEARQKRVLQLRKMLDLLVHASQCRVSQCHYPNCRKVKGLFRHGIQCKTRASGGCPLCKKMWYLLQLHARACKESACCVPRCKDLKEHLRRLQQQSDSRRRAAVMEMMRQRAVEVAGNND